MLKTLKKFKVVIFTILTISFLLAIFYSSKQKNSEIIFISSAALSGPLKEIGNEYIRGIETYFNFINDGAGVKGYKIRLITRDDQYEPTITQKNIEDELNEYENIFGILEVVGTPTSEEALKIAIKTNTPFLMPFSGAEFLYRGEYEYLYTLKPSYNLEAVEMVTYLKEKNITNVAVFYQNDSYGLSALKSVKTAIENSNIKISSEGVYNRNTISVRLAFDEITKTKPDAVIMAGAYKPTVEFISKYEKSGLKAEFLNFSFVGMDQLRIGVKNIKNRVFITQGTPCLDLNNSDSIEFLQNYKKYNPNTKPNTVSYEGYLAAKVIVYALKNASRIDKKDFLDSLNTLEITLFDNTNVIYSNTNRNGLKKAYLIEVPKND